MTVVRIPFDNVWTLARRTFLQFVTSPVAYVGGILFFSFIGALFAANFFIINQGSVAGVGALAPWALWFLVPALTMGLIADELKSGTYENLATLPVHDWEVVAGKFLGLAGALAALIGGLFLFPILVHFVTEHPSGIDWGEAIGTIGGLYCVSLLFGSMGLFASSLTRNQVVALIIGLIFCTVFFLVGQFSTIFPGILARLANFIGISSHLATLSNGVWDLRDLLYFFSLTAFFLFLTVQRLTTRRL